MAVLHGVWPLLSCKRTAKGSMKTRSLPVVLLIVAHCCIGSLFFDAPDELVSLLPRLFPFMSHGIASVRESCLKAFLTLLKDSADTGVAKSVLPRQQVYHCSEEQTISGKSKQRVG